MGQPVDILQYFAHFKLLVINIKLTKNCHFAFFRGPQFFYQFLPKPHFLAAALPLVILKPIELSAALNMFSTLDITEHV